MIPKDLYQPAEEEEDENENTKYYKHRKLPLAPEQRKLLTKKRKLGAYSVSNPESQSQSEDEEDDNDDNDEDDVDDAEVVRATEDDFTVPEEDGLVQLRLRLKDRISHLKSNRQSVKNPDRDATFVREKSNPNIHHSKKQTATTPATWQWQWQW